MTPHRALLHLALCATLLPAGCASIGANVDAARRADDAALATGDWPDDAAWIVAAGSVLSGAPDLAAAVAVAPRAAHRYVFRRGEQGDVRLTLAYHPGRGVVAGRAAADALGVRFRRRAAGGTEVVRDVRHLPAADDATVTFSLATVAGGKVFAVPAVIDPEFDGALLVSRSVAERLGLERFEIPGTADVQVALGRPFLGRRARVRVGIPQLGVEADVEAVTSR